MEKTVHNRFGPSLLVSPDSRSGSFLQIVEQLSLIGLIEECTRVCLDLKGGRLANFKHVFGFRRYVDYERLGRIMAENPVFALLYNIPLIITSLLCALVLRPRTIIANGFIAGLGISLVKPILNFFLILGYHGQTSMYLPGRLIHVLRATIAERTDLGLANSEGSREDLSLVLNRDRIEVVQSLPPPVFFQKRDRAIIRAKLQVENGFVVLYVGWLNREKRVHKLLEVIGSLPVDGEFVFCFAGAGELAESIVELSETRKDVKYFGFVTDLELLAELYTAADLAWGIADTTYLARPSIEALACGTPVVVPLTPGVLNKARAGIRIPRDLIPDSVGWVVDDDDAEGLATFLRSLAGKKVTDKMRTECGSYAKRMYLSQLEGYRRTLANRVSTGLDSRKRHAN